VEIDRKKLSTLMGGEIPFHEPGLEDLVSQNRRAGRLRFTSSMQTGPEGAEVIMVAVQTPSKPDGSVDLSFLKAAAKKLGRNLSGYAVVVIKSTVPPGTCRRVQAILDEALPPGATADVTSNPEFLQEGLAVRGALKPDRVIIGSDSQIAAEVVRNLYLPMGVPILVTNLETAELIKYASNAFLAVKISFINEIANLCEQVGADVTEVAEGMGLDKRIGPDFLKAGLGYGGSCLPKDVAALLCEARKRDISLRVIRAAEEANRVQRLRLLNQVRILCGGLRGKLIGVLGLAFKPGTGDLRSAPSLDMVQTLQRWGAHVRAYDPKAMKESARILTGVEFCSDPYEVASGADGLILVTEWDEFRWLDLRRLKDIMKSPVMVDGRNFFDPKVMAGLGFTYASVGRGPAPGDRKLRPK
jgi:UDPglucose 6-dehydrogenase